MRTLLGVRLVFTTKSIVPDEDSWSKLLHSAQSKIVFLKIILVFSLQNFGEIAPIYQLNVWNVFTC